MQNTTLYPCIRCGKNRIISKSWTETIKTISGGSSVVTHTETVCPDPECQKKVEEHLAEVRAKHLAHQKK